MTHEDSDVLLKAGKYAAALGAVSALMLLGVRLYVTPLIIEERTARQRVDTRIANMLLVIVRDRVDYLDVLETAPGPDRARKVQYVKDKWAAEMTQILNDNGKE